MAFIRKIQTNTVNASGETSLRLARISNHALGLVLHHFRQNFYRRLETAWHARGGFARSRPKQPAAQSAQNDGVNQRVQVEQTEVDDALLLDTLKREVFLQVLQVMLDVLSSGRTIRSSVLSRPYFTIEN